MRNLSGHIAALFTIMVWGVTFISTKVLLRDFTPLEILFMRFMLGWLALWLMCPRWLKIQPARVEAVFAVAGLSGVTLYFLFENIALTYTFASNVGVLVAVSPFFTALIVWLFLKGDRPGIWFVTGFALAMAGISLMTYGGMSFEINPLGDFLAVLAAFFWAVYTIMTRKLALLGFSSLMVTRRIFFYGLLFMLPCIAVDGFSVSLQELASPANYLNLLFLGLGASAICFATWTFSIKRLGAVRASLYIYLVPVVTVIAAAAILGEPLTPVSITGGALTLTGLLLAQAAQPGR